MSNAKINGVPLAELRAAVDAMQRNIDPGRRRFRVRNQWLDAGHSRTVVRDILAPGRARTTRARPLVVDADVPSLTGGCDAALDPLEQLLAALAASVTATLVWQATRSGIHVDAIVTSADGDVDLRGFLGLDRNARPGLTHVRIVVAIDAEASDADLDALVDAARELSPVVDMIARGTPISISRESPGQRNTRA